MQIRYNVRNHLKQEINPLLLAAGPTMPISHHPLKALLVALASFGAAALGVGVAHGAVLGEAAVLSPIGAPLRVEIPFPGGTATNIAECLRIAPQQGDDGLPWVRNARFEIAGQGASTRLIVTHATPVNDPVVRLGIMETCDTRLRRDYTLLLDFPTETPTAPAAETVPARIEAPRSETTRTERPRASRPRAAQPAAAATSGDTREPPAAPRTRTAVAPAQDRLVLAGGLDDTPGSLRLSRELASLDRIGNTTDAEREILRREQAVLMEIDRTIVTQMELNERIRQLEEVQVQMLERAKQIAAGTPAVPPVPESAADTGDTRDWLIPALLLTLSAALAGALLWLRRRHGQHAPDDGPLIEPELDEPPSRESPAQAWAGKLPEVRPAAQPGMPPKQPATADATWDSLPAAASEAIAPILPAAEIEEEAEEHESAIELAEIMMGFGRIQGAAETLAEFIASNPKKAVTPWLKLLEVYRAADLRQEFDALAMQLNKTFNVKAVTWDTFEEAQRDNKSMEQMAHISAKVQRMWGTVECQAYLERLLRDNRDGKREGFPLSVIDEILVLAEILEERLGPYRPSPTAPLEAQEAPAEAPAQADIVLDLPPLSFDPEPDDQKGKNVA